MDDADEARRDGAGVVDRVGRRRRPGRVQSPNSASASAHDLVRVHVAGHDERGPRRVVGPGVDARAARRASGPPPSRRRRRRAGGRGSTGRRSTRRTPRPRGGAGPPSPGAGRSGARRAGARPRPRGTPGRRTTSASSSSAGARRLAGTSRPAEIASQPASAWIEAPEPLGRLDERDRVVDLGALGQAAGRQDRRAADARRARRRRRRAAPATRRPARARASASR